MHLLECLDSLFYGAALLVGAVHASIRLFPKREPVLVVSTAIRNSKGTATASLDWPSAFLLIRLRHSCAPKGR
jgi:hypothetical protein